MNSLRILGLSLVMAVALSACGSRTTTAQDKQFLLPYSPSQPTVATSAPKLIVKTDLANHLSHHGLVFRTNATEVVQAKQNQWAYSVKEQINAFLVGSLRSKQSRYWTLAMNPVVELDEQPYLHVQFKEFNGAYTGNAELLGEWVLVDEQGTIVQTEYFQLRIPLAGEGYPALVDALATGLTQLTDDIAKQL